RMRQPPEVLESPALPELAAFYRRCRVVLGPDNGPLHLARSVGTPTVALFGPADPALFGPRPQQRPRHAVVRLPWRCIPCGRLDYSQAELAYHLCVKLIEPEQVLAAARRVLAASPVSGGV
ncbi:MAG TPA: glycosyltransferase family 9 protein, partial [Chloroflexota bacterium]